MGTVIGVSPGGRGKFAVAAMYWPGRFPALAVGTSSHSGVDAVLNEVVGVSGEWGGLTYATIAAPLTWSGSPSGWRKCDKRLKKMLPPWVPSTWLRAPNALPGAVSVQGAALTWRLAKEIKAGILPSHGVAETHALVSWASIGRDLSDMVLDYRRGTQTPERRHDCQRALLARLVEPGMIRLEGAEPHNADELDALLSALVSLGLGFPDCGLVVKTMVGGDIRPVGQRNVAVLQALP